MQNWVIYACMVLIVNSIFQMLTPNGALKSPIKFILNLFLISLILNPFFKNMLNFNSNNLLNYDYYENFKRKNQFETEFNQNKKHLEQAILILLENKGYKNFKVEIEKLNDQQPTKIIITSPTKLSDVDEANLKNLIELETGLIPQIKTI